LHPLGDGLFGCKPLYNQGFLRFNDFYLGIRGLANDIRGFGPVKEQSIKEVKAKVAKL